MIEPHFFFKELVKKNFETYIGVPDSLIKNFTNYVADHAKKHVIATNEGTALALAAGNFLKNGKPSVVYMQNSGLGNVINPLLSLNDINVYSIPALILIGWRGQPEVSDEPQHIKQGLVTRDLLNAIRVNYSVLNKKSNYIEAISKAHSYINKKNEPYIFLIEKDTFSTYDSYKKNKNFSYPSRMDILKKLLENFPEDTIYLSTTGYCSRELYQLRKINNQLHSRDFYVIGSMGHIYSVALGICMYEKDKQIVCIDGDASVLMHLGSLSLNHNINPKNLVHIIINNGAHDSVGAQPTNSFFINFKKLSLALGYKMYFSSKSIKNIKIKYDILKNKEGPILWEIFSSPGSEKDLIRPNLNLLEHRYSFMDVLK
jgi:phosphonopyruvate decarboxylase